MKSRTKALEARLAKLEAGHLPVASYVVRLSEDEWDLPEDEKQKLISERAERPFVMVGPEVCKSSEEWEALCARRGWLK
jgi:hypothetical protein